MELVLGAIIFLSGYLLCYFTVKQPEKEKETVVPMKQTKLSLRNPLKTYKKEYHQYRTKEGLYVPQRPKRHKDRKERSD